MNKKIDLKAGKESKRIDTLLKQEINIKKAKGIPMRITWGYNNGTGKYRDMKDNEINKWIQINDADFFVFLSKRNMIIDISFR